MIMVEQPPKLVWQMDKGLPNPCDEIPICEMVNDKIVIAWRKVGEIDPEKLCSKMPVAEKSRVVFESCVDRFRNLPDELSFNSKTGEVSLPYYDNRIGSPTIDNKLTVSARVVLEDILDSRTGQSLPVAGEDDRMVKYYVGAGVLAAFGIGYGIKKWTDNEVKRKHQKFMRGTRDLPNQLSAKNMSKKAGIRQNEEEIL